MTYCHERAGITLIMPLRVFSPTKKIEKGVGWLVCQLVGWSVSWSVGWCVSLLVGLSVGWLVCSWLVGLQLVSKVEFYSTLVG